MDRRFVYADNAATTEMWPQVVDEINQLNKSCYANPNSMYGLARQSNLKLNKASKKIAQLIGAKSEREIYFTSGGTESNNMAIRGVAALKESGHIITTKIEHPAVLNTLKTLEKLGYEVTYLDVDKNGIVRADKVQSCIKENTILITVMYVNNEIGTIEPIDKIAKIARQYDVPFHTDAVQAAGHIDIDVNKLGVDMLSLSAHKFGGPKGIGVLYKRHGLSLCPLITGGEQQGGMRGGTQDVAGIAAMAKALEISCNHMESERLRLTKLRDRLINGILDRIPHCKINGDLHRRICSNVNVTIDGVEGESLVLLLDMYGICASSGSACTERAQTPSHVLLALGLGENAAKCCLRLSLGAGNTQEDIDYILDVLPMAVEKLRSLSPLWKDSRV